ncbi:hypothetical protein AMECASPLE_025732 [Ameca splendens]|uniref:Uncharacterized protein n=1 Tax=Ameca splendens TaxID=208324 RepID=A0ABV0XTR4_9TELE
MLPKHFGIPADVSMSFEMHLKHLISRIHPAHAVQSSRERQNEVFVEVQQHRLPFLSSVWFQMLQQDIKIRLLLEDNMGNPFPFLFLHCTGSEKGQIFFRLHFLLNSKLHESRWSKRTFATKPCRKAVGQDCQLLL